MQFHPSPKFELESLSKVSRIDGPKFNHIWKCPGTNFIKVSEHQNHFQGIFFKPKSGFPIGFPLSPIAADIVMDNLKTKCIDSLPLQAAFYFSYVDDIFTAVSINEMDPIKKTFNSNVIFKICFIPRKYLLEYFGDWKQWGFVLLIVGKNPLLIIFSDLFPAIEIGEVSPIVGNI